MASNIEKPSAFRALLATAAILLACAAALVLLQSGSGDSSLPKLAALSQSMPTHAARALSGESAAFDALDQSAKDIAALRTDSAPGAASSWRQLETRAATIMAQREAVETFATARQALQSETATMLQLSNALLDQSGATAAIQEFQQRTDRIRELAVSMPAGGDVAISAIAENLDYLNSVANALDGAPSELDVAQLGDEARSIVLPGVMAGLTNMQQHSAALATNFATLIDLGNAQAELGTAADSLLSSAFSEGGSQSLLPEFLQNALIPVVFIALALMLLAGVWMAQARSSVFERAAKEQAEQNERNQQAILRLLDEMGSLADGDLTVKATVTEDITGAIADSINYAVEALRGLVATINGGAIQIDAAARQTQASAAHLAKASENQSRQVMASTESIANMAASIEEVSGNAERSADVARHSVDVAHKGGDAVRRTIEGMNTIRETIQETSKRIKRLGESSQEIGNIVELINDIADQTNILALNASIQASMAGEAGRGFAVVADEVQRLAEKSANATKQIEVLVRTIQADTNEAVISMERSTTDVVSGALLAENAGASLDEIEKVSNQIASLVQNISSTARQQATAAAGMTRNMGVLQEISAQTAENTGATSAAIGKLAQLAGELRKSVSGFTLPEDQEQQRSAPSNVRTRTNGALSSNTAPRVGAA